MAETLTIREQVETTVYVMDVDGIIAKVQELFWDDREDEIAELVRPIQELIAEVETEADFADNNADHFLTLDEWKQSAEQTKLCKRTTKVGAGILRYIKKHPDGQTVLAYLNH